MEEEDEEAEAVSEEVDDDDALSCIFVNGKEYLDEDDVDMDVLACALGTVRLFPHPPNGSKISKFPMGLCNTTK